MEILFIIICTILFVLGTVTNNIYVLSFITRQRIIYLEDGWKETYVTLERKSKYDPNIKLAWVYPFTMVGHVVLHPDGTTSGEAIYIKKWRYKYDKT